MVEAAPSSPFKMSEPDLLLEFLIVTFDPPAQLGNIDELTKRDVSRKRRQPIFDRLLRGVPGSKASPNAFMAEILRTLRRFTPRIAPTGAPSAFIRGLTYSPREAARR
jgi:hypothetical protein